jgi:hypothetical protein
VSVLVVEQDECCCGDRADPPRAQADLSQRLERGLEQGVSAFGQGAVAECNALTVCWVAVNFVPAVALIGQVRRWFSPS